MFHASKIGSPVDEIASNSHLASQTSGTYTQMVLVPILLMACPQFPGICCLVCSHMFQVYNVGIAIINQPPNHQKWVVYYCYTDIIAVCPNNFPRLFNHYHIFPLPIRFPVLPKGSNVVHDFCPYGKRFPGSPTEILLGVGSCDSSAGHGCFNPKVQRY